MTWEYAALEQRRGDGVRYSNSNGWFLLKTRKGNSSADSVKVSDVLYYHQHSSLDLVNMAAADGWEMTGQLPIFYNSEYARYHTCSMMRRRIA